MKKKFIIALDGPAASGKSTTARLVAKKLGYTYIDTGAMYRACALSSLKKQISLNDLKKLTQMLNEIKISIKQTEQGNIIYLNGEDVSVKIREENISLLSSKIASIPEVRTKMVSLQQEMGKDGGIVMDGRDIGTVVFPQADFKFFIIASIEIRAKRRWEELQRKGQKVDLKAISKELEWRDKNDRERSSSPLIKADDAYEIDTTDLSIDEQVTLILNIINKAR
jgi:cytidylate kinase